MAGHEVWLFEAAAHPGTGISSRNSEVLHAGIYYQPGSAKATLCVEGAELLYNLLSRRGEGVRRCGKLIVATEASELPRLEALYENARQCGVRDLELWDAARVAHREPLVHCHGAIWSPRTGILDAAALVRALRADLERAGGILVAHARVTAAEPTASGYIVAAVGDAARDADNALECDGVVNAAGLHSDEVARLPGPTHTEELPTHEFFKGSYVRLHWPRWAPQPPRCLVYPLPNHAAPGLGVHLTLDMAGGLRLGPDSERLSGRAEDYGVPDAKVAAFAEVARTYLALPTGVELSPDFAGIRPIRADCTGFRDFYIAEESRRGLPGWVNLIGIDSPGLTSCMAIARVVASHFS
jgi:L-2-hydroxyglutarate oxidase LhgO